MEQPISSLTDPTAATAAAEIATLETDPEHARATDATKPPTPPSSQEALSLDPKLAPDAKAQHANANSHKRQTSLSLDPKLAPADDAKPRPDTDANLSLGATNANGTNMSNAPADAPADAPATPPFSPSSQTPVLENTELDFEGTVAVNNDMPTEKDLKRVDDLVVLDAKGKSRPFKDLYKGSGAAPRQLIIFVRHFFCGNCQEYIRELSASISPESLLALPEPTFITIIGCGRPELIDMYVQTTNCLFPIYADPTRKLYDLLGMTHTLDLGKKPGYIQSNLFVTSVQSIVQSLKTGSNALKGGDLRQVGGEFLFESGKCVWAHRMRHTRDHAEVTQLREVVGLDAKKAPLRKRWSHSIKTVAEEKKRSSSWVRVRSKSKGMNGEKEGSKTPEKVEEESAAKAEAA